MARSKSPRGGPDGPLLLPGAAAAVGASAAPDEHFFRQQHLATPAAHGLGSDAQLLAWLRGELSAPCPGCARTISWRGRFEDMPQCPHCQNLGDLGQLRMLDRAAAAAIRDPEARCEPCAYCPKKVSFVVNVDTGREGPLAVGDVVYVVFLPAKAKGGRLAFEAMTGKNFAASGGKVVWPDGREVPLADLAFHVSHFSTCPSAAAASKQGGYRRANR